MNMPTFAFTQTNPNFVRAIVTDAEVSCPHVNNPNAEFVKTSALWDTGASNSVITPSLVSKLGLKPISQVKNRHAGGESIADVYMVDIALPNRLVIPNVRVSKCADQGDSFGMIIGMDIISLGDFSVSGQQQRRMVSFCLPSSVYVDYVQMLRQRDEYLAQQRSQQDNQQNKQNQAETT